MAVELLKKILSGIQWLEESMASTQMIENLMWLAMEVLGALGKQSQRNIPIFFLTLSIDKEIKDSTYPGILLAC